MIYTYDSYDGLTEPRNSGFAAVSFASRIAPAGFYKLSPHHNIPVRYKGHTLDYDERRQYDK